MSKQQVSQAEIEEFMRLKAENEQLKREKAEREAKLAARNKPSFSLSKKGVFNFRKGQGFGLTGSAEIFQALRDCQEFWAFLAANELKAKQDRAAWMETPEYKASAEALAAQRKAYTESQKAAV